MESRYNEEDARRLVRALEGKCDETLAARTYTGRLLGADPSLVLHGGGNTSAKTTRTSLLGESEEILYIKGSGWDLATIEPEGHPAVRLAPLRALRRLPSMTDEAMVNALRGALLDSKAPNPSVETLLHAYLPAKFIDHTHADALLIVANQPEAERFCRDVYGDTLVWVPYVMPGFALAKRCADAYEAAVAQGRKPHVMVLERHGIFTWGDTARQSYERMIDAVTEAERFVADRRRTVTFSPPKVVLGADTDVLPRVRGALARAMGLPPERGPMVSCRASEMVLVFLERRDVVRLVEAGCATPDHVLRTKPTALLLTDVGGGDGAALSTRLDEGLQRYAKAYDQYFEAMCRTKGVTRTKLDPWPRVVLLPGIGLCALGSTLVEADQAADIYEHSIPIMMDAAELGTYAPLGRADLFDMEYWSLEQAKRKPQAPLPLGGAVALVTGGASGIGRAVATRFLEQGAHVMVVDRDAKALSSAKRAFQAFGARAQVLVTDVLDARQVNDAVAAAVRHFGGLDVVVSNAGTAPEGDLGRAEGEAALRQSLDENLLAHNHVARAAVNAMTSQGTGGCLLFNASKSAFAPGPGFGPYAVAKTALLALMRQYAIDYGRAGIRANAVNADRVRTNLFGGGVLESRAAARGLTPDEYFKSNLLRREVTAEDVAEAFVHLACARTTTGAVLPVDGGNPAAFPR